MGPVSASRTIAQKAGLSEAEYERILGLLGREPTEVEVWIFSALWSEHCSYKSSLLHLRRLPRRGPRTLRLAGEENAGLLDIGEGWAVAFKVESHNHPSAVAPYQGAATGVGGIHRDILAVGARPIAALDSLHFGYPIDASTRALLEGVVRGIADYGNALGVPTIGGETYFAPAYRGKPIVNVLSVGLVPKDRVVSARAQGVGNRVLYLGAPTGPDGVGGAAFASEVLESGDKSSLAVIQVGNPFREKLLLEALGEMVAEGLIVGMQDMGAAGLASSTAETAARGGVGMRIWLDKVPLRGGVHTPQEILLSESQERMLLIATPEAVPALQRIAQKWELLLVDIGEITEGEEVEYWWQGSKVAALPPKLLLAGEGAPLYDWPKEPPAYLQEIAAFSPAKVPDIGSVGELEGALERLLAHPDLGSKAWIYRQYDRMVGGCTIGSASELPAAAPLIRLPYTDRALAVTLDGNPWWVEASPRVGTALAVAEAARQVACTGAVPLGVTNCLNFGSPQNPSIYWQFVEAVEGLREACEVLELPVTGGNVSFYNEDTEGAILPTPVIGVVGLLEEALQRWVPMALPKCAARLYLIGGPASLAEPSLGASHYLREVRGIRYAPPPRLDLTAERRLIRLLPALAAQGLLLAAQDVSDGGLLLSLLEMALAGSSGFVAIQPQGVRTDAFWFGEDGGRVVVAVASTQAQALERQVAEAGLSALALGEVVPGSGYGILYTPCGIGRLDLLRLRAKYMGCLETHLALAT